MNHINKKSIKIELDEDYILDLDERDAIEEVFWEALTLISDDDASVLDRFYTMRFDISSEGGMSAIVTSSRKREN